MEQDATHLGRGLTRYNRIAHFFAGGYDPAWAFRTRSTVTTSDIAGNTRIGLGFPFGQYPAEVVTPVGFYDYVGIVYGLETRPEGND